MIALAFLKMLAVVALVFAVSFCLGWIGCAAVPGDVWQAWQVGLLTGAVISAIAFVIGIIICLIYWLDP